MKLTSLKTGQSATVTNLSGEGAFRRHLLDMGITYGTRITVKKTAPFGDPIEIKIRGYNLSLRKEQAEHIFVEKEDAQ